MNLKKLLCFKKDKNYKEEKTKNKEKFQKIQILENTYKTSQLLFETYSNNSIEYAKRIITKDQWSLELILAKLGSDRRKIAEHDKSRESFGTYRTDGLSTLVSYERYKLLAYSTLSDLYQGYKNNDELIRLENLSDPYSSMDKKTDIKSLKKFTLYYIDKTSSKSIKIPLTEFYIVKGTGIPMVRNGMLLPDEKLFVDYAKKYILNSRSKDKKTPIRDGGIYLADKTSQFNRFVIKSKNNDNITMWEIKHTSEKYIPQLMEISKNILDDYRNHIKNKNFIEAKKSTAKFVWVFANMCPFERGSSWTAEVIASAMLKNIPEYSKINLLRSQIDFLAFGNSINSFYNKFDKLLKAKELNKETLPCEKDSLLERKFSLESLNIN